MNTMYSGNTSIKHNRRKYTDTKLSEYCSSCNPGSYEKKYLQIQNYLAENMGT